MAPRAPIVDLEDALRGFTGRAGARQFLHDHLRLDPNLHRWAVLVDISLGCNLRCPFCLNATPHTVALASPEVLQALVRELPAIATDIAFGCRHEAALHPELAETISRMASERARIGGAARLILLSSGSLFGERLVDALLPCGLDHVLFSIDTTEPETFARLRAPARWPDVRRRVEALTLHAREHGIQVGAQALLIRSTLRSLPTSLEELASMGLRSFSLSQVVDLPASLADERLRGPTSDHDEVHEVLADLAARSRALGLEVHLPEPAPAPLADEVFPLFGQGRVWDEDLLRHSRPCVCAAPWTKLRVDHEGNVFPCQFILDPALAWGNLLSSDVAAIVNDERAIELRASLLEGRPPNEVCAACPFGPSPTARREPEGFADTTEP